MANGQPTGAQGNATTENGAYTLNGATSGVHFTKNAVNPNTGTTTMWWIPSENEWYKAAYYQPQAQGGDTDNYWLYPTGTNNAPENIIGAGANQANFYAGRYSVTQSPSFESSQNYLTDGGAFSQSASFYGTYDQGGNVWEWNDGETDSFRGFRGGSWWGHSGGDFAHSLQSSYRWGESASWEDSSLGFRVASVPEPSAVALQAFRILGLSGDMTNGFTITWTCEAGYSYQLQYSDTLQAGDWHNLGTSRVWSSGELTLSHKDITAVGRDKRFYKIVRTALP
jgi:hypothetical protein